MKKVLTKTILVVVSLFSALVAQAQKEETVFYEGFDDNRNGWYSAALSNYNKATALDPNYFPPFNNRGNTYLETGKEELALAEFTESIRLNPDFSGAWKMRGGLYFSQGLYDKTIEDFTAIISRDPNNNAFIFSKK